jgi:hypothetical protein
MDEAEQINKEQASLPFALDEELDPANLLRVPRPLWSTWYRRNPSIYMQSEDWVPLANQGDVIIGTSSIQPAGVPPIQSSSTPQKPT